MSLNSHGALLPYISIKRRSVLSDTYWSRILILWVIISFRHKVGHCGCKITLQTRHEVPARPQTWHENCCNCRRRQNFESAYSLTLHAQRIVINNTESLEGSNLPWNASVNIHQTTWYYIPDDSHIRTNHRENLKPHLLESYLHAIRQNILGIQRKCRNMPVRLQEVKKFRRICHPER